jgi:hypothetical protein
MPTSPKQYLYKTAFLANAGVYVKLIEAKSDLNNNWKFLCEYSVMGDTYTDWIKEQELTNFCL